MKLQERIQLIEAEARLVEVVSRTRMRCAKCGSIEILYEGDYDGMPACLRCIDPTWVPIESRRKFEPAEHEKRAMALLREVRELLR